eukprot:GILJ01006074.1.p1 GENE.GILJ01006074.1~~GILJ01006074.1.p1  ORF type:complete len:221 (+),score=22.26 GILJ01006074.1:85-747(+)
MFDNMLKNVLRKSAVDYNVTCVLGSSFSSQRFSLLPGRVGRWEEDGAGVVYTHFSLSGLAEEKIPFVYREGRLWAVRLSFVIHNTRVVFDHILTFAHIGWEELPDSFVTPALASLDSEIVSRCNIRLEAVDSLCAYKITDIFVSMPLHLFRDMNPIAKPQVAPVKSTPAFVPASVPASLPRGVCALSEKKSCFEEQFEKSKYDKSPISTTHIFFTVECEL